MNTSSFGALISVLVMGITIEIVEHESKKAAYALVVLLLLGIITFNAGAFARQMGLIFALSNAPSRGNRQRKPERN
jgi:hypothetical protein